MKLSFAEEKAIRQIALNNNVSAVALKSKRALALIGKLQDKGLIVFDLAEGTATLTDAGRALLPEAIQKEMR